MNNIPATNKQSHERPNTWGKCIIDDIATFKGGSQPPKSTFSNKPKPDYVRLLQIRDYRSDDKATFIPKSLSKRWCCAEDIMIGRYGPPIFQILRGKNGSYNVALIKAEPKEGVYKEYLYYFLKQEPLFRLIDRLSQRSSGQTGIDMEALKQFPLGLPPLPEQEKIAEILGTWDRAIETQQNLIDSLTRRKKALMQQLLTGKTRLPGFEGEWLDVTIGSLLKEVKRPVVWSDEDTYNLLSVRRRSGGLFHRDSLKGSEIKTKVMKTTEVGDFLIAKMQVVHGAMASTTKEHHGKHVSGSYVTLLPRNPSSFSMEYFDYLSRTQRFYHLALISSYGVVIEKMTFNLKWFLDCKTSFPSSKKEQQAIAKVLTAADQEIQLHTQHLTSLRTQKRGLMQQLLTGKTRVHAI